VAAQQTWNEVRTCCLADFVQGKGCPVSLAPHQVHTGMFIACLAEVRPGRLRKHDLSNDTACAGA